MKIWFWSDTHFNHLNIIKYTGRPFKSLDEMNSTLIKKFNERVKEEDQVFFLGDFCFKSGTGRGEGEKDKPEYFLKQLKCKNIIFIQGNHDKNNSLRTCIQRVIINHGGKRINLTHNPEFADTNYEFNIVGHVHEKWQFKRIKKNNSFTDCVNVGVEQWNYAPCDINDIMQAYSTWKKAQRG
jgi:calcineurin-like phosphoesterase family protein